MVGGPKLRSGFEWTLIEYPKYNCEAPEMLNDGICSKLYNQSEKWNRSCAFRKCGVLSGLWEEALFSWHL